MSDLIARLRGEFDSIWVPPDTYLLDAGLSAEGLIAQVRLGLAALLLLFPAVNAVVEASMTGQTRVGGRSATSSETTGGPSSRCSRACST